MFISMESLVILYWNPIYCAAYGLSEAGFVAKDAIGEAKPGFTGKLIPNFSAKVLDLKSGKPLLCNNIGEICLKSPSVRYQHNL